MKKRLAMIATMLMVTVSMAACGGKKDTTADKETVINTEATEEVAGTEEPATEEVEAATETEEPETEAVAEQETTGKLESNISSAENTAAQPSDNNTSKSNKGNSNSGNKASAGSTASAGTTTSNSSGTTGSSNSNTDNSNTNASNNNAAPAHEHKWMLHEGSGHYETQVVKEAWDEPVYETQARDVCNQCGAELTADNIDAHYKKNIDTCWSWRTEYVQVQTGTVHHDAETKQVWVQDVAPYAQCSGCGEIGPVGSGISIN
ncbi:hypothetical protein ACTQ1U_12410 [Thermoguttaceae bacterium LCP21S3_D4]